ncbi:NAD(P)/FAD-dependent oxidoreductase [Orrella marina]|nr:FAD-dependent oxidoreductase [Orrella marina]
MSDSTIIIGAGHAGTALAFRLRDLGYEGDVVLVGEEPHHPYHRPLLSKAYLLSDVADEALHLKAPDLYASRRITLRSGVRVADIDARNQFVHLANGEILPYGRLVLATGSRPRMLTSSQVGATGELANVHVLRDLNHARRLRDAWMPGQHLLVVGGGYVGLEAAAVARDLGMQVTLIENSDRILSRVACAQTAEVLQSMHQSRGVRILTSTGLKCLETSPKGADMQTQTQAMCATAAILDSGERLMVDQVLVGIGVTPSVDLARMVDLVIDNGVVTDERLRTSNPHILAIGDCANFAWQGRRVRLESVPNALEMADVAAHTLMERPKGYSALPWFWSDQYDLKLQMAGLNTGYTHVVVRPRVQKEADTADPVHPDHTDHTTALTPGVISSVWYFRNQTLIAVDAFNDARAFMLGKRWIAAGLSPMPEDLADPAIPLSSLSLLQSGAGVGEPG